MTRIGEAPSWIDMVRQFASMWVFAMVLCTACSGLTRHRAAPFIDSAIATSGVVMIAAGQETDDRELVVAGTAVLVAFGLSAIHGFEALPTPAEP